MRQPLERHSGQPMRLALCCLLVALACPLVVNTAPAFAADFLADTSATPIGASPPIASPSASVQTAPARPLHPAYSPPPYFDERLRYAPDPDRSRALLGASLVFGIGGGLTAIMYLSRYEEAPANDKSTARTSLVAYSTVVSIVPSIPRFVVGDTGKGLLYAGLRGGALAAAIFVNWGRDKNDRPNWEGPFLLGFAGPISVAIIDLASTPHREDVEPSAVAGARAARPAIGIGVEYVTPVALRGPEGLHGGILSVGGAF